MCSQANLHQLLSEVLAHAQDCFGSNLDGVILYGSHARGDADEESDVDIMILVRQPAEQLARQRRFLPPSSCRTRTHSMPGRIPCPSSEM